jgi:hypothetical protein
MSKKLVRHATALIAIVGVFLSPALAQDDMTLDFSWEGIPACVGRSSKNPAFFVKNAPKSTSKLNFSLYRQKYEHGGAEVPYPPNGYVQTGLFLTIGPCNPDDYTWKVEALDVRGNVLAIAERSHRFPNLTPNRQRSSGAALSR